MGVVEPGRVIILSASVTSGFLVVCVVLSEVFTDVEGLADVVVSVVVVWVVVLILVVGGSVSSATGSVAAVMGSVVGS